MDNNECRHTSWVTQPESGEIFYPEQQKGLQPGEVRCTDACKQKFDSETALFRAQGLNVPDPEDLECLDHHDGKCTGSVELRPSLSSTGKSFPRCDGHWTNRLKRQKEINRRYASDSDVPPADFDPTYAGERWSDEH